ncbi:hypothetical protein, partial [Escherichia coli]|uniref:hypothetical protein n=1 Tax=Escherichia coli TaxID=562 RepID=UPI001BC8A139
SLKTSIKTITYLSDIGCLEIQGASLGSIFSQQPPGIPVRLSHRNLPVYLLAVTFPIIFYVSPRLLCR